MSQTEFSFDFIMLCFIASTLAGIGLITSNAVVTVASMLVSPIMGPVLAITFGGTLRDGQLVKNGFASELKALLLCVIIGLLLGLICVAAGWDTVDNWPTEEMENRAQVTGLLVGIAIAIPSGMGVALSVLGNNTSSLVGVAISASLLPPAVNAGILWMTSFLIHVGFLENTKEDSKFFSHAGLISFSLTIVNILCIWVAGMSMFVLKEVAPTRTKSAFWTRDVRVTREGNKANRAYKGADAKVLQDGLRAVLSLQSFKKKKGQETTSTKKSDEEFDEALVTSTIMMRGRNNKKNIAGGNPMSTIPLDQFAMSRTFSPTNYGTEKAKKRNELSDNSNEDGNDDNRSAESGGTGLMDLFKRPAPNEDNLELAEIIDSSREVNNKKAEMTSSGRLIDDVRFFGLEQISDLLFEGVEEELEEYQHVNETVINTMK